MWRYNYTKKDKSVQSVQLQLAAVIKQKNKREK